MSPIEQDDAAAVPQPVTVGGGPIKKKRKPRTTLSPEHISALVASYKLHFDHYAKDRVVTQIVPSSVWKKVYTDFLALYPDGTQFDNEHLKTRVRNTLKDMEANKTSYSKKQVLWRNHVNNPTPNTCPVSSPDGGAAAVGTSQSPGVEQSGASPRSQALPPPNSPPTQALSTIPLALENSLPSQAPPLANLPSSPGGQSGATTEAEVAERQANVSSSDSDEDQREPVSSEDAVCPHSRSAGAPINQNLPTHPLSQESITQMQASALYKISMDFGKLSVAFVSYLEDKKALVKQEEIKQMLANLQKAAEMGILTPDEMKNKARSALRL